VQTMASKGGMEEFRKAFPLREMQIRPANDDELKQMRPDDGMLGLECGSLDHLARVEVVEEAPTAREEAHKGCFLWVVRRDDTPAALEHCAWGRDLETKKIKHSNLTGGAPAHSGGELWVVRDKGVVVNANSGRYGARTPEELAAFVEGLRGLGFWVASMGFDLDNLARPNTVQVGPVDWHAPHE
jgi:hypothetical protein